MKIQLVDSKLQKLAGNVGDFIRYWGFRRIHGQIWVSVYLSDKPLSGTDIVKLLKVSKALVSPALQELENEGLIVKVASENSKVKRYEAVEDVQAVIKDVLNRRERLLLKKIKKSFTDLSQSVPSAKGVKMERIEQMGFMIEMAQLGLDFLLDNDVLGDN